MQINSTARIAHAIDRVYPAYRDELSALAAYLPDISRIEVQSRTERDDGVELLNVWHPSTPIPAAAQAFVRQDMLRWEDHAVWDDTAKLARWRLVVPAFRSQVRCHGETRLRAVGAHTEVALVGALDIDLARIPGMNRFLARTMKPQVEAFIGRLIRPNLERVNTALGRYLDDRYA